MIGITTDTITTVFLFEFVDKLNFDVVVSCTITAVVGFCAGVVVWLSFVGPSLVVVIKLFCVVVCTCTPPVVVLI